MKKLFALVLIMILGFLLTSFGPWYLIALAGLLGGFILRNQWSGLLIGFLGGFSLWGIHIGLITSFSESDLPVRIAQLFTLPSETILILVSALVGGLVSGFAAAAGGSLASVFKQ